MAGFRSVKKYAEAWDAGRSFTSHFRKSFSATPNLTYWHDISMHGGGPPTNFYASSPLEAATLNGNRGFYIGDNKAPSARYLTHFGYAVSGATLCGPAHLCDYLLYYPFVDTSDVTTQTLTNDVTLPRYTDGEGTMVMAVSLTGHVPLGSTFTFEYVNSRGETKTSPVCGMTVNGNALSPGAIMTSFNFTNIYGPFLPLAAGDTGVRQINNITFTSADAGLMALVIVKVLSTVVVREAGTMSEVEAITTRPGSVRVYDGAYLNIVQLISQSALSQLATGYLNFIWDEGT